MRKSIAVLALSAIAAFPASQVMADFMPPSSFPAGTSQYEILFVTAGTVPQDVVSNGLSASDYNTFVQSQLTPTLEALTTDWNAIVSTVYDPYAFINAPSISGIPVYNTLGQLITNSGLYTAATFINPPDADQNGNLMYPNLLDNNAGIVWTGASSGGNPSYDFNNGEYNVLPLLPGNNQILFPLGDNDVLTSGQVEIGYDFGGVPGWIDFGSVGGVGNNLSVYALSGPIDDPLSTPEPTSITLLGTGFLACGGLGLYRRRRRAFPPT